jgi:hypothetical protein
MKREANGLEMNEPFVQLIENKGQCGIHASVFGRKWHKFHFWNTLAFRRPMRPSSARTCVNPLFTLKDFDAPARVIPRRFG